MLQLFLLAVRNLAQHSKRTLLLGGAIAGVTALLVMLLCISSGVHATMLESATTLSTGHLNVGGFYKITAGQSAPVVTQYKTLQKIVEKTLPDLDYVAARGRGWGKLVAESGSIQVAIAGIDIAHEPGFRKVVKVADGSLDDLSKPGSALIFKDQARKLDVKVGDSLVVSSQTTRGINNTIDLRVAAIGEDVGILSAWNIYIPDTTLRQLYQLNDTTTGALQVYVRDLKKIPEDMDLLRKAFSDAGYILMDREAKPFWQKFESVNREDWTGQKLDLTTWEEEMSFFKWTLTAIDGLMTVLVIVLLIIIGIGIMNSMWIAIRERTREIGTLRAIGMQRLRVLAMFVIEAFTLGALGTGAGAAIGLVAAELLNASHPGVPKGAQLFLMSSTFKVAFEGLRIIGGMAIITGCTTMIAIIPSIHAARMKPITAMQHLGVLFLAFVALASPARAADAGAAAASKDAGAAALTKDKMVDILRGIDPRIHSSGDYKALIYLEQREKDKPDLVREALVYRRDSDEKLMILFTKPKTEAGKGYLRIDKNLWYYDPSVGKWERRTDRERIAGTDSRRQDFDQSKLAEEYDPAFESDGKLGKFDTWILKLTAKPGVDVAYPIVKFWIDKSSGNDLKREDYALSGKLMRTSLVPKWEKLYSDSKKADLWYRQDIRIYDEIDKGNSTLVLIRSIDLHPLPENMFTKAWLESKSR
jgi:ABC-type lipoprotein release transport system permease subunit